MTAPSTAHLLSMMMGLWLATNFIGRFLAGYLGTFWSSLPKTNFFLLMAAISALAALAIALLIRPLRGILKH
jgi:POT family proton-dependent oligopeptide transporter